MMSRTICTLMTLLQIIITGSAGLPQAWSESLPPEEPLAIIVNRNNPTENLSFAEVRKLFLGEQRTWGNGRKVTVVMRDPGQMERITVLRLIYRMKESDLNRHFLQAAYNGDAQATPKTLSTAVGVRKFVYNVPGAIGYVRASEVDDTVKIVRIDGASPDHQAYKLRITNR